MDQSVLEEDRNDRSYRTYYELSEFPIARCGLWGILFIDNDNTRLYDIVSEAGCFKQEHFEWLRECSESFCRLRSACGG